MIESVMRSLVPLGICKFMDTRSLAICGKKDVLIIPPPTDPNDKMRQPKKKENTNILFFKEKLRMGEYIRSRIQFIRLSPKVLMYLNLKNILASSFLGF